jgi:hypothetical protein
MPYFWYPVIYAGSSAQAISENLFSLQCTQVLGAAIAGTGSLKLLEHTGLGYLSAVKSNPEKGKLSRFAKEAMAFSQEMRASGLTPGVQTEIIWEPKNARSIRDIQDILEFWLGAEGIDLSDTDQFRSDGKLSTFIFNGFVFNSLIIQNPIFDYCNNLALTCYIYEAPGLEIGLFEDFNRINYPGSMHIRESDSSSTGYFVHFDQHIFGEPKALQIAIGTAMNLAVALAEQLAPKWHSEFGGKIIPGDKLQD